MSIKDRIEHSFGFQDDNLVEEALKIGTEKYDDILICKLAIIAAMSGNEKSIEFAKNTVRKLSEKYDRKSPYMLLKWIIQIQEGRSHGLEAQIEDWANHHPDDVAYSRATLWLKEKTSDSISIIGAYVKHLEIFWDDGFAWAKLADLYKNEKLYDRAAFAYEEAIGLFPISRYYLGAAECHLLLADEGINNEVNIKIARAQLFKVLSLDNTNDKAWHLLLPLITDQNQLIKLNAFHDSLFPHLKTN